MKQYITSRTFGAVILFIIISAVNPLITWSQWNTNPSINSVLSANFGDQERPSIISDGASGAIAVWEDRRDYGTTGSDIYAVRIDSAGVVMWQYHGLAVSTASSTQRYPCLTTDGAHGAIIAWEDERSGSTYDIYAQRIDSVGNAKWTTNGIIICNAINDQYLPQITNDGVGGAIITWQDSRASDDDNIYAQRVDASGNTLWTPNGVALVTDPGFQVAPLIVGNDDQGGIITWTDFRNSTPDIYSQMIDSAGVVQWSSNGEPICTEASAGQAPSAIISDRFGGAIIVWQDSRNAGYGLDIFAQRIDSSGVVQWTVDGRTIIHAPGSQLSPVAATDGAGGAIIAWEDGNLDDIYTARVSISGILEWTNVAICTADGFQGNLDITSDNSGGAIITWQDALFDTADIYAQRVDADGQPLWVNNGLEVSIAPSEQRYPVIALSGNEGAIVAWLDFRGVDQDIYCNRISPVVNIGDFTGFNGNFKFDPSIYFDFTDIDPLGSEFDIKVSQYFQQPPNPIFDASRISSISDRHFWAIDAMNVPLGTSYSTDLTFNFDPVAALGAVSCCSHHRIRIATRETSVGPFMLSSSPMQFPSQLGMVKIKNVTQFSQWILCVVPETTLSVPIAENWNMISVPLAVEDYQKSTLFPNSSSDAFRYSGSYLKQDTMNNGSGYWIKSSIIDTPQIVGTDMESLTIDVEAKWNMIGSISEPVSVFSITSNPPGIVTSSFFGYNGAYAAAYTIEPGKAYWVKTSQAGQLTLSSSSIEPVSKRIRIIPTAEQPPTPPGGNSEPTTSNIPSVFSLEQNYPNPFNPSTVIGYQLPANSYVTLKVFDVLGREIVTLVDGFEEAGFKSVKFEATAEPTGIYFYHIVITTVRGIMLDGFRDIKKMLLIK